MFAGKQTAAQPSAVVRRENVKKRQHRKVNAEKNQNADKNIKQLGCLRLQEKAAPGCGCGAAGRFQKEDRMSMAAAGI